MIEIKKAGYCFVFFSLVGLLMGCTSTSSKMNPEIRLHSHKLTVSWKGVPRLSGGIPVLENTNLKYHEVIHRREKMPDSVYVFEFMHNFKDHVEIKAIVSPTNNTVVFWLSPHQFHTQKASDFVGILFDSIPEFSKGNVFHKYGPVGAWTHPTIVNKPNEMEAKDNQFFFWKYSDGAYGAALPLLGKGYVASLGVYQGMIGSKGYHTQNGNNENEIPILAIAFGEDPTQTIDHLYHAALGMSKPPDNKSLPALFEQLGWCSWNSQGHQVSHDSLIGAAQSFRENNIPVKWILIDDGWSEVSGRNGKLKSLGANKEKFPLGLGHTVQTLKESYGIEHVGVWHTMNGYWGGIDPYSKLGVKYREKLYSYTDKVTWTEDAPSVFFLPSPIENKGKAFFEDWYSYLHQEGIDFIKVDNQLIGEKVAQNHLPHGEVAVALLRNFQLPARHFFKDNILNCMGLTNDVLLNLGTRSIIRSSEDYFPENNSFHLKAGNHAVHVYNNIMNNIWLHPVALTDFDMFQTHRPHAHYHALARVLHNGPVYITDAAWQHNWSLVNAISLSNGQVLQADTPLLPLDKCLFQPLEEGILTAKSTCGNAILLGAWNTTSSYQETTLTWTETVGDNHSLLFDWDERTIQKMQTKATPIPLRLEALHCKHYLAFNHAPFVSIGLAEKFVTMAAVEHEVIQVDKATIKLKESGTFLAYCEREIEKIWSNETEVPYTFEENLLKIETSDTTFTIFFT